ncbi:MAG TPA: glycosyltransferase family 4 protein [Acidimicrobiales bacterium]|nr:glycosyltransferase family 4 protein [Acidimicrobiales bacterium]
MTPEGAAAAAPGPGGAAGLRVAMVCPYDLSRPGGVQGQALGLARALRRTGHDVVVVAPDARRAGWVTGHAYVAGRSVGLSANGSVAPVSISPLAARRAVDAVREWGADVVHLHEPLAPALGYGFLLAGRWPVVGTFHRSGVPRAAPFISPFARLACGRIQVRAAVSDVARRTAAAMCGGDVEVLFNGVDMARFAGAHPVASARPAVFFLGRHERRKGLGVLLDAFSGLSARGTDAELWVAGSGPETEALRLRYPESERVRWLGVVSDEEAADRLSGAAVLCAPSLGGESFGMVLLEAMAARCRVVASDIPGYREASGGHATLVPPGDARALEGALVRLLGEPATPSVLDAGSAHAEGWSTDRLAARYVDAYARARRRWGRSVGGNVAER